MMLSIIQTAPKSISQFARIINFSGTTFNQLLWFKNNSYDKSLFPKKYSKSQKYTLQCLQK